MENMVSVACSLTNQSSVVIAWSALEAIERYRTCRERCSDLLSNVKECGCGECKDDNDDIDVEDSDKNERTQSPIPAGHHSRSYLVIACMMLIQHNPRLGHLKSG
jgi:hypothetical protein